MAVPTLSKFFDTEFRKYRLQAKNLDPKTVKSYEQTVAWWVRFTGNPPMDQIDDDMAADFIIYMMSRKGKQSGTMKVGSVIKHVRNIKTIVRFAGPRQFYPGGRGIISTCAYFDPPKQEKKKPHKSWTIKELRQMFAAADRMTWPTLPGVSAPDWWRAFIAIGFYTGFRITALTSARYSQIHDRWLTSLAEDSKGKRSQRQWLHIEALQHADIIRRPDRDVILSVPGKPSSGKRKFYEQLRVLQEHAEIPKTRKWAAHSFRQSHLTQLGVLAIGANQALQAAQNSAGHANLSMTLGAYVSGDVQEMIMASQIDRLPSPCFPPDYDEQSEKVELAKPVDQIVPGAADPICYEWMG